MPVILHFVADWSGPSRPHRIEVAEAASQLGLEVVEVDVDNDPGTAQQHGVVNLPAVALMSDSNDLLCLVVGAVPSNELVAQFQPLLG